MIPASLLGRLRQGPVKEPVVQLGSGEAGHSFLGASLLWGTRAGGTMAFSPRLSGLCPWGVGF